MNLTFPRLTVLVAFLAPLSAGCNGEIPSPPEGTWRMITAAVLPPRGSFPAGLINGQCLPHPAAVDDMGAADCVAIQVRSTDTCACDAAQGLVPVEPEHLDALAAALEQAKAQASTPVDWNCACEGQQLVDAAGAGATCQDQETLPEGDADGEPLAGFCYVDPTLTPARGNGAVAANCPAEARHYIRFVGGWAQEDEEWKSVFLSCGVASGD
jgi:hypothetical protein